MANQIIALNQIAMSSGASRRRKKQQVTLKGNCTLLAHLSQMSWNRYHVHKPDPKSSSCVISNATVMCTNEGTCISRSVCY